MKWEFFAFHYQWKKVNDEYLLGSVPNMHLPLHLHKMICRVSLGTTALYCSFDHTSISYSALTCSITNLNPFLGKGFTACSLFVLLQLPPSMSVCCWLSLRCPQLPGTRQGGPTLMQGEQSSIHCCTRVWLLHTYLPHNIYRPPGKEEK